MGFRVGEPRCLGYLRLYIRKVDLLEGTDESRKCRRIWVKLFKGEDTLERLKEDERCFT